MKKYMFILLFSTLTSCASHTIYTFPNKPMGRTITDKNTYYLFGLFGEKYDIQKKCRKKSLSRYEHMSTIPDILIRGLTLGIILPTTVKVRCGGRIS